MNTRAPRCLDGFLEAGWLTALVTVPLFFSTQTAQSFEPDKLALLRLLALVMAAICLLRWFDGRGWHRPREEPLLTVPVLLLVVAYIAATAFSVDAVTSWFGSYQRAQGAHTLLAYVTILGVMATTLRERIQLERLLAAIMITSVPVALYVIVQRYGLDPLPWSTDVQRRAGGQLGNPIFAAAYLIMVVPLTLARAGPALAGLVRLRRRSPAAMAYAAALLSVLALQLTAIAFTLARGPWLGLAFGLLLFLLLLLAKPAPGGPAMPRPLQLRDVLVSFAIGLVLVLLPLVLVSHLLHSPGRPSLSLGLYLGITGMVFVAVAAVRVRRYGIQRMLMDLVMLVLLGLGLVVALNTAPEPGTGERRDAWTQDLRQTLHDWRGIPALHRMGRLAEWDRGTGRVRVLIWEGVLELLRDREPLVDTQGKPDPFAMLRPLVGYGPETMQLVYQRYYPTELGAVDRHGLFPDRSHNDLYDALITTGVFGLLAWHLLFLAAFHHGLQRLGVLCTWRHRFTFVSCWLGGGLLSAAVLVTGLGAPYLGIAIPLGMLAGLGTYLFGFALFARATDGSAAVPIAPGERWLIAGLLAAISAHFLEIHLGIATSATRLQFFASLGLLVASRHAFARDPAGNAPAHEPGTRRFHEAASHPWHAAPMLPEWMSRGLILGLALGTALVPFVHWSLVEHGLPGSSDPIPGAWKMLADLVTHAPGLASPGLPGLLLFVLAPTWMLGTVLLQAAPWRSGADPGSGPSRSATLTAGTRPIVVALIGPALAVLLAFGQISILRHALVAPGADVSHGTGIATQGGVVEAVVQSAVYAPVALALFGAVLGLALMRCRQRGRTPTARPAVLLVATLMLPPAAYVATTANLGPIRADALHRQATAAWQVPAEGVPGTAADERTSEVAVTAARQAVKLVPREEVYRMSLAHLLSVTAQQADPPAQREEAMLESREHLAAARSMHPFRPAPATNLARWHLRRAAMLPEESRAAELAAAIAHYRDAIHLSPRDARFRNEYARLLVQTGAGCLPALEALQVSASIDPYLADTRFLLAAHATACADAKPPSERAGLREEVIENLAAGLQLEPANPRRLMLAAEIHLRWDGGAALAIDRHAEARTLATDAYPAWRMDVAMAQWFQDRGDPAQAARYARLALESAPPTLHPRLQRFLEQLPALTDEAPP